MVTCIVAATFGLVFTIISSIGLGINSSGYYRYSGDNHNPAVAGICGFQASTFWGVPSIVTFCLSISYMFHQPLV